MKNKQPKFFYGYVIVAAAFCAMTIAWGANRSFGVFLEPMLSEFGWTRAGISGAYTLGMIIMGFFSIISGRLADRFGSRVVVIGSGIFIGAGYLLISQVNTMWQLYLFYGVLTGIGMSGTFTPLLSTVAHWFVKRRGLMSSIIIAGPALGIAVMPLVASLIISDYGWRTSYLVLGGVVLTGIVGAAMFLRRNPRELGLLPYGSIREEPDGADLPLGGLSLREAVHTRQFWLLFLVNFGELFLMNIITVHIVIHAIGLGVPAISAAGILTVAAGVSIPARVIVGLIADRIGYKPGLIICFVMSIMAFVLLLVVREAWALYLFAVIFGFGLWSSGALMAPITAELFGLKSHATILGCVCFAGALGGAIGPVLAGYIFDVTGNYQLAFILCLAVSVVSLISLILLKMTGVRGASIEGQ
ncbi:MFS transporter [Chloroflexota bacterium]